MQAFFYSQFLKLNRILDEKNNMGAIQPFNSISGGFPFGEMIYRALTNSARYGIHSVGSRRITSSTQPKKTVAKSKTQTDGYDSIEISEESRTKAEGIIPNSEAKLDDEQLRKINELKTIDRKVRAHEMAHLAAAGPYAKSGINFNYTKGPDGVLYATGGEVQIDTSPIKGDPKATIEKAKVVQRAALAPADPSPQDKAVAAKAAAMEAKAEAELQQTNSENNQFNASFALTENPQGDLNNSYGFNDSISSIGNVLNLTA